MLICALALPPAPASQPVALIAPASVPVEANSDLADSVEVDSDEDEEAGPIAGNDPEAEVPSSQPVDDTLRYSLDINEHELEQKFAKELPAMGSISVGFTDSGRLINGVRVPEDDAVNLVVPEYAWGTAETVSWLTAVAHAVRTVFPEAPALRINHIGKKDGGYLRPHRSHQSGRDVDIGFWYRNGIGPGGLPRDRTKLMDLAANWTFIRSVVTMTDVQMILVDRKVQNVLYEHALAAGEDKDWLDSLFKAGASSIVQHARKHRDHFHVRFFSPRSQELGRRVQPILNKRPDENKTLYRVHSGDTLGHIAKKWGSTVAMIQKANGMRNSFLTLGRSLVIPMRGPCTQCPLPPPFVVPPRRLPPPSQHASLE